MNVRRCAALARLLALVTALGSTPAAVAAQSPQPVADLDAYTFFLGDWTCRTGYDNVAHKSCERHDDVVEMRSSWGAEGGPEGGAIAEHYGSNGTNLWASTEFRGANGVRMAADYASPGWQNDTLTFVGRFAGNIGRGNQAMIYTRLDANTFDRRFVTGPPPRVTSVERCERGRTVPQTAPTMPPPG